MSFEERRKAALEKLTQERIRELAEEKAGYDEWLIRVVEPAIVLMSLEAKYFREQTLAECIVSDPEETYVVHEQGSEGNKISCIAHRFEILDRQSRRPLLVVESNLERGYCAQFTIIPCLEAWRFRRNAWHTFDWDPSATQNSISWQDESDALRREELTYSDRDPDGLRNAISTLLADVLARYELDGGRAHDLAVVDRISTSEAIRIRQQLHAALMALLVVAVGFIGGLIWVGWQFWRSMY